MRFKLTKIISNLKKTYSLIKEKYPKIIKEIRGRGLLIGIQLYKHQNIFVFIFPAKGQ